MNENKGIKRKKKHTNCVYKMGGWLSVYIFMVVRYLMDDIAKINHLDAPQRYTSFWWLLSSDVSGVVFFICEKC